MNYQCAVMEVETKFNVLNNRLSIQGEHNPIETIKSRVKSLDSIIRKLEKNNLPIAQEDVTLIKRKDYIKDPKPSGYRSLHLIIKTPIYTENGKKDINPKTAEELATELLTCAETSAKLDETMLKIRDHISGDVSAARRS